MSGLFATLAAAARGEERALTARNQSTFEPEGGDAWARWHADSEDEEGTGRADGRADGQGRTRFPTEASATDAKPQQRASLLQPAQDGQADALAAPARARPEHANAQGPRPARTPGQKADEATYQRGHASAPSQATLLPDNASAASPNETAATARSTTVPGQIPLTAQDVADHPADVILLPGAARADTNSSVPDMLVPTDRLTTGPRDQASRTLTIGRIEVRPPAPAAKAPVAAYRAPSIPRAMPRQSLDDYRRRGR